MSLSLDDIYKAANKLKKRAPYEIWLSDSESCVVDADLVIKASAVNFAEHHHDEEDPKACKLIIYYITEGVWPQVVVPTAEANAEHQETLTNAWYLCHKYTMPKLQNLIMGTLLTLMETVYTEMDPIKVAFRKTPPGSPLRKLMAEQLVCRISMAELEDYQVLGDFEDIKGAMVEIADALGAYHRDNTVCNARAGELKKREYMVQE